MKIQYYKTNIGNFFSIVNSGYASTLQQQNIVEIAGEDVTTLGTVAITSKWYKFDGELKNFKRKVPGALTHTGFKLVNESLASDKIPLNLSIDEVKATWDDDKDDYTFYSPAFKGMEGLYKKSYSKSEDSIQDVEVEVELLRELEIDSYNAPQQMLVRTTGESVWGVSGAKTIDLATVVHFSDIERMLTPEFLLHDRPCRLTSKQVYGIVRQHIIDNMNTRAIKITSNYDFCFDVSRIIQTKQTSFKKEVLTGRGKSYKPPRFTTSYSSTKSVKIFEMTWAGYKSGNAGYDGYTCIEPWEADSLQELYENMQKYLHELMYTLNAAVHECPNCNGVGAVVDTVKTNEREGF